MRLEKKILRKRCRESLSLAVVNFLNLSGLNLDVLEHLSHCKELHWLIASDNALQSDEGITRLKQLWYLDMSNNQIKNIHNLSKFLALGTLVLTNNNLKWADLERLSHAHIMSLSLNGNPQLDSDPYYRIHVIDSLPLVWELDGRLVTVTERLHVKQFFVDTQFTDRPVRHKTCRTFQTTSLRNIGTEGIVSKECKYIYSKFPMSEKHTKHTDERRLKYLCNMVQENIKEMLDQANIVGPMNDNFLNDLLKQRHTDVERCNMVLLLLVITLEFRLPTGLVRATLVSAQLDMIGNVSTMTLFLLPREHRARVVSVLINAAKVDRDNNVKNEGGLYPQLFMCLYYTVAQLTWIRQTSRNNMNNVPPIAHDSDYMALMASEAVSLIVQNTRFCSYFTTESGVGALVVAATGSFDIVLDIKDKLLEAGNKIGGPDQEVYELINQMILEAIEIRLSKVNIKMSDIPVGDRYLSLSDSLPIKPLHSVIWASNFLSNGKQVPCTDPPILNPAREAMKPKPVQPRIGEKVLLGPQVVGELAMLLEGDVAMARIDEVPVANGAVVRKLKSSDAHFTFVDMKSLCFGKDIGMWRPIKTAGDKYSIHSTEPNETVKCKYDARSSRDEVYTAPLIYTPTDGGEFSGRRGDAMMFGRPQSSTGVRTNEKSRRLSVAMVRRVMSADRNDSNPSHPRNTVDMSEFRQYLMQDHLLQNNNNPNTTTTTNNNNNYVVPYLSASAATTAILHSKQGQGTTASSDAHHHHHHHHHHHQRQQQQHQQQQHQQHQQQQQKKKPRVGSGLSCSSLHQHDNVHYIAGFTPREDSSRSNTVSIMTATPLTTERQSQSQTVVGVGVGVGRDGDVTGRFHQTWPEEENENEVPEEEEADNQAAGDDDGIPVSSSTPKGGANPEIETSKKSQSIAEKDSAATPHSTRNHQRTDDETATERSLEPATRPADGAESREADGEEEEEGTRTVHPHVHSTHESGDGERTGTEGAGDATGPQDNCPICIAVANGSLVRVGQGDDGGAQEESQNAAVQIPGVSDHSGMSTLQGREPAMGEGTLQSSNDDVERRAATENAENIAPALIRGDPASKSMVLSSGGLRASAGASQMLKHERPKSAVESYNYYIVQQPQVFASGTSAKINERNASNGFKTDFQQEREDAWRRTTRNRRQRPLTATIMTSSQFPPPQRPSSPSMHQQHHLMNPGLKITKTDRWLGGGRDLYWESVRKRPKSGHTPGWKEGLPASMRKRRPMSAYAMPLTPRQYLTRSVTSTAGNYQHQEYSNYDGNYIRELGDKEGTLFMPQAHRIQPSPDAAPPRQLTTPVSEEEHRPLLVEGTPPPSIPNPSKRYTSRYSTLGPSYSYTNLDYDYICEGDEVGYEGRPSSQLSFNNNNNDDPDLHVYYYNDNSSSRILIPSKNDSDDRNCFPAVLFKQDTQTYHISPRPYNYNGDAANSNAIYYNLCSHHREMVFPYYAGPVVYD